MNQTTDNRWKRWIRSCALLALQALLLGASLSAWWAQRNNTLFGNGRWISGKDTGKYVFYSYEFLFRSLEDSSINLSRDMGFQEILYREKEGPNRRVTRIRAEVLITGGSYLWLELHKSGQQMLGVRLTRHSRYPGGFYTYDTNGDVVDMQPLSMDVPRFDEGFRWVDLRLEDGEWRLTLDDLEFGRYPEQPGLEGHVGFKGSGNPAAAVRVKNIHMYFTDPETGRTWMEREKFNPRGATRRRLAGSILLAAGFLLLRRLRRRTLTRSMPPDSQSRYAVADDVGLSLLFAPAWFLAGVSSGLPLAGLVLASEIWSFSVLGVVRRRAGADEASAPGLETALFGIALVVLCGTVFRMHGEQLLRPGYIKPDRMDDINPSAFLLYPDGTGPSTPVEVTEPFDVAPGAPFFTKENAFREQEITVDFVMPQACTLDVVFQQQSFKTYGDADGELLPFRRRLVRLSTRDDVAWGFSLRTRNRPAPLSVLNGSIRPDAENHLRIRTDQEGILVELNGEQTFLKGFRPLCSGETGLMAFDAPVRINRLSVKATSGREVRDKLFGWMGFALPVLSACLFWGLLRVGGRIPFRDAAAAHWGALIPLALYLMLAATLDTWSLAFMGRDRLAWLDIALLASVVGHLAAVLLLRRRIRHAVVLFNLGLLCLLAFGAALVWDRLPEENALRLRFTSNAEAPGETIDSVEGARGPWYANNRIIGSSTYVWRQQFGGEELAVPKPDGVVRIFVVGGSQAWGSGAASSAETYDALLEQRLRAKGLPVEIYNAAVNGAGTGKILRYVDELLIPFEADIIVADIGLNDSAAMRVTKGDDRRERQMKGLLKKFKKTVETVEQNNVDMVLSLAPMCGETPLRPISEYYTKIAEIAREHGFEVVDASAAFEEKEPDHLLWWDTAHMAPRGQHLLAEMLEPVVERRVRERLARSAGSDP